MYNVREPTRQNLGVDANNAKRLLLIGYSEQEAMENPEFCLRRLAKFG
jgi:hypothetical protein